MQYQTIIKSPRNTRTPSLRITMLNICLLMFLSATGQTTLMTFNIRFANPGDNENSWTNRKADVAHMLNYYRPDVFGIQEGLKDQVEFIQQSLDGYAYTGVARDDGKEEGEYTAIFFKTDRFELITSETFWLSDTPSTPSYGWDASYRRIVTVAVLRNSHTRDSIYVLNCHFDNNGKIARRNSAAQIVEYLEQNNLTAKQVVVMGDFNCVTHEDPIIILKSNLEDAFEATAVPPYGPTGTFNGFDCEKIPERRIDYIFTRNMDVLTYRAIDDRRPNNLCLSDHLAILVKVE